MHKPERAGLQPGGQWTPEVQANFPRRLSAADLVYVLAGLDLHSIESAARAALANSYGASSGASHLLNVRSFCLCLPSAMTLCQARKDTECLSDGHACS